MESSFDRCRNREERLSFVRSYARWVMSVPNEVWSQQQAELVDSFMEGASKGMSAASYLSLLGKRRRRAPPP